VLYPVYRTIVPDFTKSAASQHAMFGKKSSKPEVTPMSKQVSSPIPGQINMIGEGTVVEGTYRAAGDIRVSGRIVGKLLAEGKVIVTQEGEIDGEIVAASADIAGSVVGEISVKERLVLKNSAKIDGNVRALRLVVEEGAVFGGKCQMGETGAVEKEFKHERPAKVEAVNGNGSGPKIAAHV
jgi:cytoskeletal protein CcmA (bactofilin family)